uniref:Tyrosine-protein phosphatase domain-containing protein n=1 Tax=Rhabditophanes sp. KR3021 TaxID=114890 RepID=A0AC35UAG0_9BILA
MDFIKAIYLGQEPFRTKSTSADQERLKKGSYESGKTGLITRTIGDFWHMSTQNNTRQILMLCQIKEKKKRKCRNRNGSWSFPHQKRSNLIYGPYEDNCICVGRRVKDAREEYTSKVVRKEQ